ncbi:hypothetical protein BDZ91DRAFT_853355 [Kalaharituber pfeilii]|nr:hypothetical protein BDZ91DRAFT_853355 [Kalaharituber pfeilii]
MATLTKNHPLYNIPVCDRDPTILCEVIAQDIDEFPQKTESQRNESLRLIEELLTPLVTDTASSETLTSRAFHPELTHERLLRHSTAKPCILEPENEQEVQDIVKKALKTNKIVRVVGSRHSVAASIDDSTSSVLLSIKKLRSIHITPPTSNAPARVTVGGGCHLGKDPQDSSSTLENSLLHTINAAGYALPDLGGISHQTVAGFLMTSSAGGSLEDGLHDCVVGLRFVNGLGDIKEYTKDSNDPEFYAAGVSMGLFGILTSATFTLMPNFFIQGTQTTSPIHPTSTNPALGCPVDILGDGSTDIPSLKEHLEKTQYTRLLWWPQRDLNRITVWKAKSVSVIDPDTHQQREIKEYEELPRIGGSSILAQSAARVVLIALNLLESNNELYRKLAAKLLGLFTPVPGAQSFCDWWWRGLPMDNEISDTILPVSFTELWFPIDKTKAVMNDLNTLFNTDFSAIGNFFTELYAAKKSPFWMSPSFDGNMIRVDVTWFTANERGSAREFYQPYWEKLAPREYRCHWGKYTPDDYGTKVKKLYSKYDAWMEVRAKMDPHQVFVTPYWRNRLAIPEKCEG